MVRDALVTATVCDVIDDGEFVLLCDVYSPRSRNSPNNFDINTLSEDECHTKPWFFKQDLDKLFECLGIPEKKYRVNKEQFVVVWMVSRFGKNPEELCLIFNAIVDLIYVNHNRRLRSWDQSFL